MARPVGPTVGSAVEVDRETDPPQVTWFVQAFGALGPHTGAWAHEFVFLLCC